MKRGRIELFRPYRATTAKSIPYPGRRSAAIAAALCPGLICGCPFGANAAVRPEKANAAVRPERPQQTSPGQSAAAIAAERRPGYGIDFAAVAL
jgi:hypothetical protein